LSASPARASSGFSLSLSIKSSDAFTGSSALIASSKGDYLSSLSPSAPAFSFSSSSLGGNSSIPSLLSLFLS
jgi:hypothetical protein